MTVMLVSFCISIASGALCAHIAHGKRLAVTWYALAGLVLPVIGLVVVMVEPPAPPPAPLRCASCEAKLAP